MLFTSGSSVNVIRDSESVSMWHVVIYQRRRLARGKKKDWRRWQARMQYGIRLEQAMEKVGEHFSVVAWEQQPQCVGRARSH